MEISGQEALGTRNPLSTGTVSQDRRAGLGAPRSGLPSRSLTFGQMCGQEGSSGYMGEVGPQAGEAELVPLTS
jgi:hypothetical protein